MSNDSKKGLPINPNTREAEKGEAQNRSDGNVSKPDWSNNDRQEEGYKPIEDTTSSSPPSDSGTTDS